MRICVTHFTFYPTPGNVESHLLELCGALVREGHEVLALVGSRERSPAFEEIDGIQVHRVNWLNLDQVRDRKKKAGYAPAVLWPELMDEIRENYQSFIGIHGIDVVHAHNFHHFVPEYGMALSQLHDEGQPTLLTIHELWNDVLCEEILQKTAWDQVITVSKHVAVGIRLLAPHLENLRVLYMGVNTELFSPENGGKGAAHWARELKLKGRPMIMHPAAMLPMKGVVYSVRALELICNEFPDALLLITDSPHVLVGAGELENYKEEVRGEINYRGLENNAVCRSIEYKQLPAVYANASVVIYPTIGEEPFGIAPVQAMACGKPVVVTRSGGLVESVLDGKTGFIVDKRDEKALAERCLACLRDKELARKMGEAGRKHVLKSFGRERMAAETAALYENAMSRSVLV
ncbi:MAG TPA: glycosyltransferase family 4 protein [Planctomycetota bacterium]|nr:glycosyltransferase family 4 protein [Planctomycetota bacterium]